MAMDLVLAAPAAAMGPAAWRDSSCASLLLAALPSGLVELAKRIPLEDLIAPWRCFLRVSDHVGVEVFALPVLFVDVERVFWRAPFAQLFVLAAGPETDYVFYAASRARQRLGRLWPQLDGFLRRLCSVLLFGFLLLAVVGVYGAPDGVVLVWIFVFFKVDLAGHFFFIVASVPARLWRCFASLIFPVVIVVLFLVVLQFAVGIAVAMYRHVRGRRAMIQNCLWAWQNGCG